MIKIPIIIRNSPNHRIFLPVTETVVDKLPPLRAVIILTFTNEGNYVWENKKLNNDIGKELYEKLQDSEIIEGEDEEVEPWIVESEKTLKEHGFDDLAKRTKDVQSLAIRKMGMNKAKQLTNLPKTDEIIQLQLEDEYCCAWREAILKKEPGNLGKGHYNAFKDNITIDKEGVLVLRHKETRQSRPNEEKNGYFYHSLWQRQY